MYIKNEKFEKTIKLLNENIDEFKQIIDNDISLIFEKTMFKNTLLSLAVLESNLEAVEYLIKKGSDINFKTIDEKTLLDLSLKLSKKNIRLKIIKTLLENGINLNSLNIDEIDDKRIVNLIKKYI